jgi:hypothetical protein
MFELKWRFSLRSKIEAKFRGFWTAEDEQWVLFFFMREPFRQSVFLREIDLSVVWDERAPLQAI